MARKIIDLDVLLPEDLTVKVGGKDYDFPGDAPVEQILRVSALIERQEDAAQEIRDGKLTLSLEEQLTMREELAGALEELFRLRNPNLEEGSITLTDGQALGLVQQLFTFYFTGDDADGPDGDEEGGARPTESQASSQPKPKSSGRSRPRSRAKGRKASASSTS